MTDINVSLDGYKLNIRSAGLLVSGNHFLLHKKQGDNFYASIGGRVKIGENSLETVKREFSEELSIHVDINSLSWVVENNDFKWFTIEKIPHIGTNVKPVFFNEIDDWFPDSTLHIINQDN